MSSLKVTEKQRNRKQICSFFSCFRITFFFFFNILNSHIPVCVRKTSTACAYRLHVQNHKTVRHWFDNYNWLQDDSHICKTYPGVSHVREHLKGNFNVVNEWLTFQSFFWLWNNFSCTFGIWFQQFMKKWKCLSKVSDYHRLLKLLPSLVSPILYLIIPKIMQH